MGTRKFLCSVAAVAAALALGGCGPAPERSAGQVEQAAQVEPVFITGNHTCAELGYGPFEFKIEPVISGTYDLGSQSITIVVDGAGQFFDWSSTIGMDAVFAKGGPDGNLYVYDPEAYSDEGLHSPINSSTGQPYGLSHISFCYDFEVQVTKTAVTSFTRTYEWTIDKSVAPEVWPLFTGDTGTSLYTVAIGQSYTDSDWAVEGLISIENPAPFGATIDSVADVCDGITMAVDCGVTFPYALGAGETLVCTYAGALPDGLDRTNEATVETCGLVGGGSATAAVDFDLATIAEVNPTINVSDSVAGSLGTFDGPGTATYTRSFACDTDEGTHGNTATIVETGQSDSAAVTVECYELAVTKDALPSIDRTWSWTIDKAVTPAELTLLPDETAPVDYVVTLTAAVAQEAFGAEGSIVISNSHPVRDAALTGVADVVSPAIAATVSCPSLTVPAGGSITCTYAADLPDGEARTNTATATLQNFAFDAALAATPAGTTDFTGSAAVDFTVADLSEADDCIDVSDTLMGVLGTVCASASPATFTYQRTIGPYAQEDCGDVQVDNTASFVACDSGATGSDDAGVLVHVMCLWEGCTPGFWMNHPEAWVEYSPADTLESVFDVPDLFGLDNMSCMTALQVNANIGLKGAARRLLRHAVAALLNASSEPVDYPMAEAEIIAAVNAALLGDAAGMTALKNQLEGYNQLGSDLCE